MNTSIIKRVLVVLMETVLNGLTMVVLLIMVITTKDCSDIIAYGIDSSLRGYIETATWHLNGSGTAQSKQNWYLCEKRRKRLYTFWTKSGRC